jgi:hypothetical protein
MTRASASEIARRPIIVIGAPRSGTNMLRDVLTSLPGVCTWPCDEINYIWRHGNAALPHDEFSPDHATPRVQAYIRQAFESLARAERARAIVEKTCANSLRVGFVDRIFPKATYIWIVRDGRDAVASAIRRWTAPLDLAYVVRKARYVPFSDLPRYAFSYARNRITRYFSPQRRLSNWGPRFQGMQAMLRERSLAEVCAAQWLRCVASARRDLAAIEPSRVTRVNYEQFVAQPAAELQKVLDRLGIRPSADELRAAVQQVSDGSVGKWRAAFDEYTLARVAPLLDPQLIELGYQSTRHGRLAARAA